MKAILVNIFGGIVDCAVIAKGITKANRGLDLGVPIVVRLEGKLIETRIVVVPAAKQLLINRG